MDMDNIFISKKELKKYLDNFNHLVFHFEDKYLYLFLKIYKDDKNNYYYNAKNRMRNLGYVGFDNGVSFQKNNRSFVSFFNDIMTKYGQVLIKCLSTERAKTLMSKNKSLVFIDYKLDRSY